MIKHILKCHPQFFKDIASGKKQFEVRKNDRKYEVNDQITLREYDPISKKYSGKELDFSITYVLKNFDGIKKNWVIMAIKQIENYHYLDQEEIKFL